MIWKGIFYFLPHKFYSKRPKGRKYIFLKAKT